MNREHWAVFMDNNSNKSGFIIRLLNGEAGVAFEAFQNLEGVLFSKLVLKKFIDEEDRHDIKRIIPNTTQSLKSMSSGEQKKALLQYLLEGTPDYIILDNPFDNLDTESQEGLIRTLTQRSQRTLFIQIIHRKNDLLPFITNFARLEDDKLVLYKNKQTIFDTAHVSVFTSAIPSVLHPIVYKDNLLVALKNVTVRYENKLIVRNLNWTIRKGEFWQLIGKNGSGKTTILSMLTGENPKGYGQELFLFGRKKGSGESIWDIKKHIGYFTPSMTDQFSGHHTIENMLISGFHDSIGLYVKPTESQLRLAKEWLVLINMWHIKELLFRDLSTGQQRLIMTTRAMMKHPLLLILDEPTTGLDDASAKLLVALANKIGKESKTATIFVSHRKEPGLEPDFVYELEMTDNGSIGHIK